ncbi:MAG: TonB family protein [Steroidobacteraceae bacterium]
MSEFWTKWEGAVVNGVYPLHRFLNGSDHSAVFLTEYKAQNLSNAAIKIVPADRTAAEAQLSLWRTAAALSHPHLIRLFDTGHCQFGGQEFLFVVMEYAEETLSQILPHRALTSDEVREMLLPALDALAFLHRRNLVQGQLKPPNVLVVNDQVKLASDTIRPVGRSAAKIAKVSLYDPPEARTGTISAASDVWGLGVTTVEALTQHPPTWQGERFETVGLPTTLPATFSDALQRCLSQNPANRPTTTDLAALFQRPPPASLVSAPQPVVREAPVGAVAPQTSAKQRVLIPAIAVVLITLLAVWVGLRLFRSPPNSRQSASSNDQASSQQAAALQNAATSLPAPPEISAPSSGAKSTRSKPASSRAVSPSPGPSAQPLADASPSVVHEQLPVVPRSARETIHGRIKVAVLVIVDRSGKVIDATLEIPGPSGYFARLAREAAGKWKFSPASDQESRKYLVTFEFTRSDTTGKVAAPRS